MSYNIKQNYSKNNKCLLCNTLINNNSKHCRKCCIEYAKKAGLQAGENNSNYRHGRREKGYKGRCITCGKPTSRTRSTGKCIKCCNIGRVQSKETRLKQSKSHLGAKNPMYGRSSPHGKRLNYKGIYMRSSWETAYAKFLDKKGIL